VAIGSASSPRRATTVTAIDEVNPSPVFGSMMCE
jgi:hypothetical protein